MQTSTELALRTPDLGQRLGLEVKQTVLTWKGRSYSYGSLDALSARIVEMLLDTLPENVHGKVADWRLKPYIVWLIETGSHPLEVRLHDFCQDMLDQWIEDNPDDSDGMNNTILGWHSNIKSAYTKLNETSRDFMVLKDRIARQLSPKDPRYILDGLEKMMSIGLAEKPGLLRVKIEKENPARPRWLKHFEIELLLKLISDYGDFSSLRNRAWIGLSTCTALRREELLHVHLEDLRQRTKQRRLGLFVRKPKSTSLGIIKRTVPYGQLDYGLRWAEEWASVAGIKSGPLWVGVYGRYVHLDRPIIDVNRINMILRKYPLGKTEDGEDVIVTNHTLRRTYARMQAIGPLNEETGEYDKPMPIEDVAELMGHASVDMTRDHYIGTGWKGIEPQFVYGPEMEKRIEELRSDPEYRIAIPRSKGRWHSRIKTRLHGSAPQNWFFLYDVIEHHELSRKHKSICNRAANTLEEKGEVWQFIFKESGQYQKRAIAKPGTIPFRIKRDRSTLQKHNEFKPTERTQAMLEEWQRKNAQDT